MEFALVHVVGLGSTACADGMGEVVAGRDGGWWRTKTSS